MSVSRRTQGQNVVEGKTMGRSVVHRSRAIDKRYHTQPCVSWCPENACDGFKHRRGGRRSRNNPAHNTKTQKSFSASREPTHTQHPNPSRFVRTKLSHALSYLQPSSPNTGPALIGRPRREEEQPYPLRAMVFRMRLPPDPVNRVRNDIMRSGRSIRMIP
jgi:hypothetical protein